MNTIEKTESISSNTKSTNYIMEQGSVSDYLRPSKALIIGNGESRSWFKPCHRIIMDNNVITYGCNAIYRAGAHCVHNLVAVDYAMQQEIYDSGWAQENPEYSDMHGVYFTNWSIVPADVVDMMFMGFDIPDEFVHRSKNKTDSCVIQGKDPTTVQEKIDIAIKMNPNLSVPDLVEKMEKDIGVWITYVESNDMVVPIDLSFPWSIEWSTGNTAIYLACQHGAKEVYILGFDLSSYDEPLNNLYKGTDNYLSNKAKGFNSNNWRNQMQTVFKEFPDIQFYWIDATKHSYFNHYSNLKYLTKSDLCNRLQIY